VADIKLYLFGAPRLERNGVTVELDTRKAIALLAYLTLTGQPRRRDTLAALLWPEQDQASARGALRRTLSPLNKALGGVGLLADRETVWLDNSAPLWSDIAAFQRLLRAARPRAAQSPDQCDSIVEPLAAAVALAHDDFILSRFLCFRLRQHGTLSLLCVVFALARAKKRHTRDWKSPGSESPI